MEETYLLSNPSPQPYLLFAWGNREVIPVALQRGRTKQNFPELCLQVERNCQYSHTPQKAWILVWWPTEEFVFRMERYKIESSDNEIPHFTSSHLLVKSHGPSPIPKSHSLKHCLLFYSCNKYFIKYLPRARYFEYTISFNSHNS